MRSMLWQHINCNNGEPIYSVTYREPKHFCISNAGFKVKDVQSFMKIHPVGGELSHADGQTEMTKLIVTFRNFTNAPKMFGQKSWRI